MTDYWNNSRPNNYTFYPHYDIIRVNGPESAHSFRMGPNSSCFLADTIDPHRAWIAQTDGAGFLTLTQLDVNIHQEAPQPSLADMDERIKRLEDMYGQLNIGSSKQQKKRNNASATESAVTAAGSTSTAG